MSKRPPFSPNATQESLAEHCRYVYEVYGRDDAITPCIRAVDAGVPLRYLADLLGVSHETVRRWVK